MWVTTGPDALLEDSGPHGEWQNDEFKEYGGGNCHALIRELKVEAIKVRYCGGCSSRQGQPSCSGLDAARTRSRRVMFSGSVLKSYLRFWDSHSLLSPSHRNEPPVSLYLQFQRFFCLSIYKVCDARYCDIILCDTDFAVSLTRHRLLFELSAN